jgi:hypothetical protein
MTKTIEVSKPYGGINGWDRPVAVEITSEDKIWIDFKGHEIRVEQDRNFNDGKLMITVHKPNEDYHTKILIEEIENE